MATVRDLATLALDVYSQENNELAREAGWERLDGQSWANGFAAGTYRKHRGGEHVVAFRGTDDLDDVIADLIMVPLLREGAARRALTQLLDQYDVPSGSLFDLAPGLVERLGRAGMNNGVIQSLANQVPPDQVRQARQYVARGPTPTFLTGHSLGGALTKVLCLDAGIPGVAFNSPFMGELRGVRPVSTAAVASVNTIGDPLSTLTWSVTGGLTHGPVVPVMVPRKHAPPRMHRTGMLARLVTGGLAGVVAGEIRDQYEFHERLLEYLQAVLLHFHGMGPLQKAISTARRFQRPLGRDLSHV